MKRSASASFDSSPPPPDSSNDRKTQSVQRKKSSKLKDDYPSPFRIKKAPAQASSSKPLTPLPVNEASKPSVKELAAAKEARIRLGYDQSDVGGGPRVLEVQLPSGEEPTKGIEAEYISTEELEPLTDASGTLDLILDQLKSTNWQEMIEALNTVRRLIVYSSKDAKLILEPLVNAVLKLMKNPRSLVSKTAIMCFTDMITFLGDEIVPLLDKEGPQKPGNSVLSQLFLKATTDKQFVAEEVKKTLNAIGKGLDIDKLMELVIPYTQHKNQKIRGKAGLLLVMPVDRIQESQFTGPVLCRILQVAANLITDKTPDAREAAKRLICKLQSVHRGQEVKSLDPADGVVDVDVSKEEGKSEESCLSDSEDAEKIPSDWRRFCEQHLTTTQVLAVMKVHNSEK